MKIWQLSFISLLAISPLSFAKKRAIAKVESVQGKCFVLRSGSSMAELTAKQELHDFDEILADESCLISFTDFSDHRYHLGPGGHVKILNRILDVKSGRVWVQSEHPHPGFNVQSANAWVDFKADEFIFTFDPTTGVSQVLVLDGEVEFANSFHLNDRRRVMAAQFSVVNPNVNDGHPRRSTLVSYDSYRTMTTAFNGINPRKNEVVAVIERSKKAQKSPVLRAATPERKVASVEEKGMPAVPKKKSGIIFVPKVIKRTVKKAKRMPASTTTEMVKKEVCAEVCADKTSSVKKAIKRNVNRSVTRVFRFPNKGTRSAVVPREPKRQLARVRRPAQAQQTDAGVISEFERTLEQQMQKQTRHPKELNKLINELESYKKDYQIHY